MGKYENEVEGEEEGEAEGEEKEKRNEVSIIEEEGELFLR